MMITIHDLKEFLYVVQTILGFLCVGMALLLLQSCGQPDSISSIVSGLILLLVGIFALFFGLETFLLRDDADIWR